MASPVAPFAATLARFAVTAAVLAALFARWTAWLAICEPVASPTSRRAVGDLGWRFAVSWGVTTKAAAVREDGCEAPASPVSALEFCRFDLPFPRS